MSIQRFLQRSTAHYFLFGPRGTGKSTWLKAQYPAATSIDLLNPELARAYSAHPERLKELVMASVSQEIIIDEIEKVPELLSVVHSLIEAKVNKQFIMTGSSARKLRRVGVNLLGGRASMRHMHPFMAAELGAAFRLKTALEIGLVPIITQSQTSAETLQAYVGIYLREEVMQESLVRNIGHFARFLEVMSFSHAQVLNLSNIARECGVSRKLIEGYLSVLEDLLLCSFLPVFTRRAKRATANHPKFYYFDVGIFRHLRTQGPLDTKEELNGAALEGLVLQHLRAWNDYQNTPNQLYYWRTRAGVEVDFVVYGPNTFWALEVKNGKNIAPQDLRALKNFSEDYPEAIPILLYTGEERLKKQNILCLPVTEFLTNLNPTTAYFVANHSNNGDN